MELFRDRKSNRFVQNLFCMIRDIPGKHTHLLQNNQIQADQPRLASGMELKVALAIIAWLRIAVLFVRVYGTMLF